MALALAAGHPMELPLRFSLELLPIIMTRMEKTKMAYHSFSRVRTQIDTYLARNKLQ